MLRNYKYSIIAPSSLGVRITPFDNQPLGIGCLYKMQATSAETNALSVPASLGLPVKVLTKFVDDSPIASFIKADLRARKIDYEGIDVPQGGPWGYRHQFNIADSGFGVRAPRVYNDRAGEIGITLNVQDFDIDRIFKKEGVRILYLSGLICSLSPETSNFCLELARSAKKNQSLVCFDLNYRNSLWKNREADLKIVFKEIASFSDILIGNDIAFGQCLGIKAPEAGSGKFFMDEYRDMLSAVQKEYSDARVVISTLRQAVSANQHLWGAIALRESKLAVIEPAKIDVYDRIGGGDAFSGGYLYGFLNGWDNEKCTQFGWACGAFAVTVFYDYPVLLNENQIWDIWFENKFNIKGDFYEKS